MTALGLSLRFGAGHPLQIVMFQPLFEEYNRCRRLLCEVGRRLDRESLGIVLVDLSAMGESLTSSDLLSFAKWRSEAAAVVEEIRPILVASVRGGALFDDLGEARGRWRFAPESGARVVRDLRRTALTGETGLYGGHSLTEKFLTELAQAVPAPTAPLRTVRLEGNGQDADAKVSGSPLWRRAEPGDDAGLADALAADLAYWTRQCAAA